ncbi:MAG: hypothetical protein ACLFXM_11530 [Acidimicrobiia bacterium]
MATAHDEHPTRLVVDIRRACPRPGGTGRDGTDCGGTDRGGTGPGSAGRVDGGAQALDRMAATGAVHA